MHTLKESGIHIGLVPECELKLEESLQMGNWTHLRILTYQLNRQYYWLPYIA